MEVLNQTFFSRSGKFNFGPSTVTSSHQHLGGPRANLSSLFPVFFIRPLSRFPVISSLVMAQRRDEIFSPRRSTCRNVPVKYSRGFMAVFQSIIEVYPGWKIKRHPSWPRTSACQSIDARRISLALPFSIFSILAHTLLSRPFIFDAVAKFRSGFLVAFLFDLSVFSFFIFSLADSSLGRGSEWKGNVEEISL